jgi:hypothetical protein
MAISSVALLHVVRRFYFVPDENRDSYRSWLKEAVVLFRIDSWMAVLKPSTRAYHAAAPRLLAHSPDSRAQPYKGCLGATSGP